MTVHSQHTGALQHAKLQASPHTHAARTSTFISSVSEIPRRGCCNEGLPLCLCCRCPALCSHCISTQHCPHCLYTVPVQQQPWDGALEGSKASYVLFSRHC